MFVEYSSSSFRFFCYIFLNYSFLSFDFLCSEHFIYLHFVCFSFHFIKKKKNSAQIFPLRSALCSLCSSCSFFSVFPHNEPYYILSLIFLFSLVKFLLCDTNKQHFPSVLPYFFTFLPPPPPSLHCLSCAREEKV